MITNRNKKYQTTSIVRSQTIIAARYEIQIPAISEKLQLLANLWLYVSVVRVELTQAVLKCVDIVDLKLMFTDGFHTLHHFYKPTSRFLSFVTQKQSSVPFREHGIFRFDFAVANDKYFSGLRDLVQQDMGANPARTSGCGCQRLSLRNNFANKKMFRNDKQIDDTQLLQAIVHEK